MKSFPSTISEVVDGSESHLVMLATWKVALSMVDC